MDTENPYQAPRIVATPNTTPRGVRWRAVMAWILPLAWSIGGCFPTLAFTGLLGFIAITSLILIAGWYFTFAGAIGHLRGCRGVLGNALMGVVTNGLLTAFVIYAGLHLYSRVQAEPRLIEMRERSERIRRGEGTAEDLPFVDPDAYRKKLRDEAE